MDLELEEYLYVDDKRLDSYVEQIGSFVTYDKAPVYNVNLSLAGPGVGAVQQRFQRPLSRHEKIVKLLDYLEKGEFLGQGRLSDREEATAMYRPPAKAKVFRLETCEAARVLIPSINSPESRTVRQELNLWFSDRHHAGSIRRECLDYLLRPAQLLLIVGFHKDDYAAHFEAWSAYSALESLRRELSGELPETMLRQLTTEKPWESSLQQRFLTDPIAALRGTGAQVADWRQIESLYRVRHAVLCKDLVDEGEAIATVGYPIFIRAKGL